MTDLLVGRCSDVEAAGYNVLRGGLAVDDALHSAGIHIDTITSAGLETLIDPAQQRHYDDIVGALATHPCVLEAELLVDAPDPVPWVKFSEDLATKVGKPILHLRKMQADSHNPLVAWERQTDRTQAESARRITVLSGIVRTLRTAAQIRHQLPLKANVHSLGLVLVGTVNPHHSQAFSGEHYIYERHHWPTRKAS